MNWDQEFTNKGEQVVPCLVNAPSAHQGVGDALRSAFTERQRDLPKDMEELLNLLD